MFKDKLKDLREKENLSQQELADKLFVSRSAVAKWENGKGLPSDVNIESICKFFDIDKKTLMLKKEDLIYTRRKKYIFLKHLIGITVIDLLIFLVGIFLMIDAYKEKIEFIDDIVFYEKTVVLNETSNFTITEENIKVLKERFDYVNCLYGGYFDTDVISKDNKGRRQEIDILPMFSCFVNTGVYAIYDIEGIVVKRSPQKVELLYGRIFKDTSDKFEIVIDLDTALLCFEQENCVGEYLQTPYGDFKVIGVVSNTKERQVLKNNSEHGHIEQAFPVTGYISHALAEVINENGQFSSYNKNCYRILISDEDKSASEIKNIIEILYEIPTNDLHLTIETRDTYLPDNTSNIIRDTNKLYIISIVVLLVGMLGVIFIFKAYKEYTVFKKIRTN